MNDDQFDDLLRDAARSYNVPPATPREEMWARIEASRRSAAPPVMMGRRSSPWLRTAAGIAAILLLGIAIGRASNDGIGVDSGSTVASTGTTPTAAPAGTISNEDTQYVASADEPGAAPSAGPAVDDGPSARVVGGRGTAASRFASRDPRPAAPARGRFGRTYGVPRNTPGVVGDGTGMNAHRLAVVEHLARTEVLLTGFRAGDLARGRAATPADAEQFGRLSRELLQNTRLLLATRATDDPLLNRLLEDLELVLMQIAQYAAEGGARRGDLDAINQSLDRRNVLPKLRSNIPAGAPAPAGT